MSPRALLFSSDEGTSTRLRQALEGLELEVVHCREIFAAIEQVTSRSFGVIVCDWDDGVEAAFLLKTSRELTSTRNAVMVAVMRDRHSKPAPADIVLTKPVSAESARYTLLNSDAFLAGLRSWLPELLARQSRVNPLSHESESPAGTSGCNADSDGQPDLFVRHAYSRPNSRRAYRGTMLPAVIALFVCATLYFATEPVQGDTATSVVENAWIRVADGLASPAMQQAAAAAQANPSRSGSGNERGIRVVPVHASIDSQIDHHPHRVRTEAPQQTEQLPPTPKPAIPESLRTPIQTASDRTPVPSTPLRFTPLEPVMISAEISKKLLLEAVQPIYPEQALKAGLDGPVTFLASIGRDGRVEELKLVRGSLVLADSAYRAVRQWRYRPYLLNGQAVEAQTYVTIDFRQR